MTGPIPQHIMIEKARRERELFTKQRDVAAESIRQLSDGLTELAEVETATHPELRPITEALRAVISVRILELQMAHDNLQPRIAELDAALKTVDSGLLLPQGVKIS